MKQFESFALDMSNECLWHKGEQIDLPPKPFAVLRYLVDHPGRLITHDELLEALWPETYVQPQVLRTYMLDLRKILDDDAGQPRFIQTVPKRGYRFVAQVHDAQQSDAPPERRASDRPESVRPDRVQSTSDHPEAAQPESSPGSESTAGTHDDKSPAIIDRIAELALLNRIVKLLSEGQRQVVFLTGEAGIGKTALVDTFCRQFRPSASISVARGQCVEGFGPKEEYYPVMEALSQLCASPEGERACGILARMAPAWLGAMGRPSGPAVDAARAGTPDRMPGDLCAALEELAAEKPLIVVFEDLHWGDAATHHLISALARRRAAAKLMVLATFNIQHVPAEHPIKALKQDLLMRRLCIEISLAPLTRIAVSELLRRELGLNPGQDPNLETLPPGLSHFIHRHSEGNPLFVISLLEHLIAQRHLVRDGTDETARWKQCAAFEEMEADVPDGLAQMVELEIARLTEEEQSLLEAGSLMSVAFPAWAVAAALGKDAADTEDACDGLAHRVHFLQRGGQDELPDGSSSAFYAFAHGLYREVLYRRQPASRRSKGHRRIAERLSQLFEGREAVVAREIAMHYEAGCHWLQAVHALRIAARHALERQAHAEGAELLEHALRVATNLSDQAHNAAAEQIHGELVAFRVAVADARK